MLKINDPQIIENFRPLCLIGCIYKVISKILANRIKVVIGLLMSANKLSFKIGLFLTGLLLVELLLGLRQSKEKLSYLMLILKKLLIRFVGNSCMILLAKWHFQSNG